MSITVEEKTRLMKEFATKEGDTGSPEVQVAILTSRITTLTEHFKTHKKDNHGRRGLLKMVALRRKLLDYTKGKDEARYQDLIKRLAFAANPAIRRIGGARRQRICSSKNRDVRPVSNSLKDFSKPPQPRLGGFVFTDKGVTSPWIFFSSPPPALNNPSRRKRAKKGSKLRP